MKLLLVSLCVNVGNAYKKLLLDYEDIDDVFVANGIEHCIQILGSKQIDLAVVSSDCLKRMTPAAQLIRAANLEQPKKVLMVEQVSGRVVMEAIQHGFNDVVGLNLPAEEIMSRLRLVVSGDTDLSRLTYVQGIRALVGPENKARFAHDEVDLRILLQLAHGCSNKEISEAVFLSLQTVRNRISRLMQVTKAQNRTQLALMFMLD